MADAATIAPPAEEKPPQPTTCEPPKEPPQPTTCEPPKEPPQPTTCEPPKPPPAEKGSKGPLDYIAGLLKDDDAEDKGDVKINIKQCEMPDDMKEHATSTATPLVKEKKPHKDIASALKKEFDSKYEPTFICIVGTDFGSSITHTKDCFIYMYLNKTAIMLFKV